MLKFNISLKILYRNRILYCLIFLRSFQELLNDHCGTAFSKFGIRHHIGDCIHSLLPGLADEDALPQICMHIMQHSECARYIADEKVQQRRETADRLAREYHADGIIYEQMKYCDYWGFERALVSHIMHEEYDWPVLSIDRLYNNGNSGQLRTRVQAFVESLEIKRIQSEK